MGVSKETFNSLLKSGRVLHSALLSLRYIKPTKNEDKSNQYAFVVSSKVAKLATDRNLLKRRGRAIINKHKGEIISPLICAFFFKSGSLKLNFAELEKEIVNLLKNANLTK